MELKKLAVMALAHIQGSYVSMLRDESRFQDAIGRMSNELALVAANDGIAYLQHRTLQPGLSESVIQGM